MEQTNHVIFGYYVYVKDNPRKLQRSGVKDVITHDSFLEMTWKIRAIADARISIKGTLVVYTSPDGMAIDEHTYASIRPGDTLNAIIDYDCNHDRSAVGMDSYLAIAEDMHRRLAHPEAANGNPAESRVSPSSHWRQALNPTSACQSHPQRSPAAPRTGRSRPAGTTARPPGRSRSTE